MEELFNGFMKLKWDMQALAGIVQNPDMKVTKEELEEWNVIANKTFDKLQRLMVKVNELYSK